MPPLCAAVIVTYHPDIATLLANVRAIAPQVDHVYLSDNSTSLAVKQELAQLAIAEQVSYLDNGGNLGIATALNRGCARALADNCQWIVTLDQDSVVTDNWLLHTFAALNAIAATDPSIRPALFGAVFHDARSSVMHQQVVGDAAYAAVTATITSGSVLDLHAWQTVGGFADAYFIDYVDIEMCLRLRQAGFAIYELRKNRLQHELGTPTVHRLFGLRMIATHHSPLRRYHLVRNSLWLYRSYWRSDRRYIVADSKRILKQLCKIVLLEQQRPAKLAAIGRGLWHGLTRTPPR